MDALHQFGGQQHFHVGSLPGPLGCKVRERALHLPRSTFVTMT